MGRASIAVSRLREIVAGIIVALIVAAPASASAPTVGTGSGTIAVRSITPVRAAGGNLIQERELAGTVTGALEGTFVQQVQGVIHPSGLVTFAGTMTFTGTVAGCGSGTLTLGVSGQGVAGAPVTESRVRVINAAANTIAVHGVGTVSQTGPSVTYVVQYQCG
jgi:hypothetical protein